MKNSRGAIDVLEEAVQLLRAAPASAHLTYLAGAVPFILALLFFWNDMTHSAFASEHLVTGSLALAVLFIWKNVWQAMFNVRLFRVLSPGSAQSGNLWRLILVEATIQPVSLLIPLPFPWLVAFFRNASLFTALGEPDPMRARSPAGDPMDAAELGDSVDPDSGKPDRICQRADHADSDPATGA